MSKQRGRRSAVEQPRSAAVGLRDKYYPLFVTKRNNIFQFIEQLEACITSNNLHNNQHSVSTCSTYNVGHMTYIINQNSTLSLLMNKNSNHQLEIAESRQQKINFDLRSLAGWAITRAEGNFSPENTLQLLKERVSWMEKAQYKAALKK
jgi:hypothetical protein